MAACTRPASSENTAASTTQDSVGSAQVITLTSEQLKNARIETGTLQTRTMGTPLKVNGFMDVPPQQMVSVSFPLGGYVKSTKLLPGMRIKRGETLAILEDPQYITLQQEYLSCKARMEYLSADLARQEDLNRDHSASDKALQLARSEYQTQYIASKALAEKLLLIGLDPDRLSPEGISRTVVLRSPIDGYVSAIKVNPGKYVAPTDVLFELVDTRNMHLNLRIFEKDIRQLRIGQKVHAHTNADAVATYSGHIILIGRQVGEDRSIEVHCHLDNSAATLLPGMFMTAEIESEHRNAQVVPADAVVRFDNKHYIFAATAPDTFEMVQVEPGTTEAGYMELTGSSETALRSRPIVLKNAYTLLMKMKNTTE